MFLYITFALGDCFPVRYLLRSTRALLALVAIGVVILSIVSAVSICAIGGVEITLIIGDVIPFIVLAIGVDNVFLIFKAFSTQPKRLAHEVGAVGERRRCWPLTSVNAAARSAWRTRCQPSDPPSV